MSSIDFDDYIDQKTACTSFAPWAHETVYCDEVPVQCFVGNEEHHDHGGNGWTWTDEQSLPSVAADLSWVTKTGLLYTRLCLYNKPPQVGDFVVIRDLVDLNETYFGRVKVLVLGSKAIVDVDWGEEPND